MNGPRRTAGFQSGGAAGGSPPKVINTEVLQATHIRVQATDSWPALIGCRVDVWRRGMLHRSGVVADALPTSGGLWLASEGVFQREFIDVASGYEVWVPHTSDYSPDPAERHAQPAF